MKMLSTPTAAAISDYPAYVHNCLRNRQCEPSWLAPLPGVPYLQLYVDYGSEQPNTVEFWLRDVCTNGSEQIFPSNYIVGQDADGRWYGVYKYFNSPLVPVTSFVVWHSALVETEAGLQERTFFSQMLVVEPCLPLTKVKACHPEGATSTGFDVNGLYYGLPTGVTFGIPGVRYFHIAYVRLGKVRELSVKGTFTASLISNFRTVIEKTWQLEFELVPQWYKDVLLAIFARGAIQVNDDAIKLVSELNFEALNDDDLMWKAYPQLKQTLRLYFGCDESVCNECCSPQVISASVTSEASSESDSGSASEPPVPQQFPGQIASNSGGSGNVILSVKFNGVNVSYFSGDNLPIGFNDNGTFKSPSMFPNTVNVAVEVGIGVSPPVGGVTVTGTDGVEQNQATPTSGTYIFPLVVIDSLDEFWSVLMGTFL
jgi:hypothetical protein